MKAFILALAILALAPAAWAGGQGEKVRIYDENYHYRGYIQKGRIYDEKSFYRGKIEKAPARPGQKRRQILSPDYRPRYYLERSKKP